MYTYYKAEGLDFLGFHCIIYFRTKKIIENTKILATYLYCEETDNAITSVHTPRASYALAYAWYTLRGKHTTPEEWSADVISTVTV